jgi:hypothetical protein
MVESQNASFRLTCSATGNKNFETLSMARKLVLGWLIVTMGFAHSLEAGTTGSLSGFVRDRETGNPLPGAAVIVENTTFGATADKHGFYVIHNLPVGNYNLRATMIGYLPTKVTEVEVKTDLRTPVSFVLSARALQVENEIVITAPLQACIMSAATICRSPCRRRHFKMPCHWYPALWPIVFAAAEPPTHSF